MALLVVMQVMLGMMRRWLVGRMEALLAWRATTPLAAALATQATQSPARSGRARAQCRVQARRGRVR